MLRMLLKRCPRCRGDLQLQLGLDGADWSCVQCGHVAGAASPGAAAPVPIPVRSVAMTAEQRRAQ
jgi:hypothetical protein